MCLGLETLWYETMRYARFTSDRMCQASNKFRLPPSPADSHCCNAHNQCIHFRSYATDHSENRRIHFVFIVRYILRAIKKATHTQLHHSCWYSNWTHIIYIRLSHLISSAMSAFPMNLMWASYQCVPVAVFYALCPFFWIIFLIHSTLGIGRIRFTGFDSRLSLFIKYSGCHHWEIAYNFDMMSRKNMNANLKCGIFK